MVSICCPFEDKGKCKCSCIRSNKCIVLDGYRCIMCRAPLK